MGVAIISRSCSGGLEPEGYTSQVTPGFPAPGRRGERTRFTVRSRRGRARSGRPDIRPRTYDVWPRRTIDDPRHRPYRSTTCARLGRSRCILGRNVRESHAEIIDRPGGGNRRIGVACAPGQCRTGEAVQSAVPDLARGGDTEHHRHPQERDAERQLEHQLVPDHGGDCRQQASGSTRSPRERRSVEREQDDLCDGISTLKPLQIATLHAEHHGAQRGVYGRIDRVDGRGLHGQLPQRRPLPPAHARRSRNPRS